MLFARNRKILDHAGIVVVSAHYKEKLTTHVLIRDHEFPVEFSGGQVPLGEVHEWLLQYEEVRSAQARNTRILIIVSTCIALALLTVAIVAFLTRH